MDTLSHTPDHWRTRIVGYSLVDVADLVPNERNWRIHPTAQQLALTAVLDTVGLLAPITLNLRTSPLWPPMDRHVVTLLDGHCRVLLALRHSQPHLPALTVDLSPTEEATALATLDTLTTQAVPDASLLADLLTDTVPLQTNATLTAFLLSLMPDHLSSPPPHSHCPTCHRPYPVSYPVPEG